MGAQEGAKQAKLCGDGSAPQKSPRTTRELYAILEKKFTRKTLIITLRELSLDLNVMQPTHIRTEKGYGLGYRLNPRVKEIAKSVQKFSRP